MMGALGKFLTKAAGKAEQYGAMGMGAAAKQIPGDLAAGVGQGAKAAFGAARRDPGAAGVGAGLGAAGMAMSDDDLDDLSDEELMQLLRERGMYGGG